MQKIEAINIKYKLLLQHSLYKQAIIRVIIFNVTTSFTILQMVWMRVPIEVKLCTKWFKDWQKNSMLGYPKLTFHEIRHSSSTYKLRISGGDTKSVQGDTGHAKADTLINTYSHIEDHQRMHLTSTIEEDFYGTSPKQLNSSEDDILELIKNNPELRNKILSSLLSDVQA